MTPEVAALLGDEVEVPFIGDMIETADFGGDLQVKQSFFQNLSEEFMLSMG